MEKPAGLRTTLYNTQQLDAVIDNMARQAAGLLTARKQICIVGILRRGAPLADRLRDKLERQYAIRDVMRLNLQIKRYADDLTLLHPETRLIEAPEQAQLDLSGYTLLVVDDVMYQGHSLLRAVQYLSQKHPLEIRTVVLVDRGVAKLPVRTDVVGVRLDVAPPDIIECNVPPYEDEFKIELLQPTARAQA